MTPLTVSAVARSCGIYRSTALQKIRCGFLKAYRLHPKAVWKVDVEELERFKLEHGYPRLTK